MATPDRAAAARAMVVLDKREPYQPHLFVRGNPSVLGEPVERRILDSVLDRRRASGGF
ncbi:MAG: hypothetical protein R3B96_14265 [Pirellulaceae bacterium]